MWKSKNNKMYYTTEELKELSLKAIEEHKLFFIGDVVAFLPISTSTFYNHELEKVEEIREALSENKIQIKISLRNKWYNSGNATLQILLYRLLADDEERRRISQQYLEVSGEIETHAQIDVNLLDDETIARIRAAKAKPQLTDGRGPDSD